MHPFLRPPLAWPTLVWPVLLAAALAGGPGLAQTLPDPAGGGGPPLTGALPEGVTVLPSPILTMDQDALFARSAFGQRVRREIEEASRQLAAENRQLEGELAREERELTDQRANLPVEEFRSRAAAFDQKVERIRDERDTRARDLNRRADQERKRFLEAALPVLKALIAEEGAVAIVDVRAIVLSSQSIDVTDTAVARLDQVLGDGSALPKEEAGTDGSAPQQPAAEAPGR